MSHSLGFDGGGTKTECVLLDAGGALVARAVAGPSNPIRIGFRSACQNLREAADKVLAEAGLEARQVRGVCAGLAGAGSSAVVKRVMAFLVEVFPAAAVHVTTDSAIALEAAVGAGAGVVLIAGTGSICLGRNAAGQTARAGGMGPWVGDEGSAFDIGRRAVVEVARARDSLAPPSRLAESIPAALEIPVWEDLLGAIAEEPDHVFPRIFPLVVEAAGGGDAVAREILVAAARGLDAIAASVVRRLGLEGEEFTLAKTGGVFGHSRILDDALDALLARTAPRARIGNLAIPPALGAARWALRLAAASAGHGARR